jgi:hypothetical protein
MSGRRSNSRFSSGGWGKVLSNQPNLKALVSVWNVFDKPSTQTMPRKQRGQIGQSYNKTRRVRTADQTQMVEEHSSSAKTIEGIPETR